MSLLWGLKFPSFLQNDFKKWGTLARGCSAKRCGVSRWTRSERVDIIPTTCDTVPPGVLMKLKRIKVENFRSIQMLDIELAQVCAIVGPNNAGKSNILEALRRVLAGDWGPRASNFSEDDVYQRDSELDVTIECSFDPPIEYRRLKDGDALQLVDGF